MHLFDLRTIPSKPWVNGAGTRQELASSQQHATTAWWLSVAKIERDCAFSTYPGLARLHVVISGPGTHLVGKGVDLHARPMVPVAFDGDTALECRLNGGPCTAFNVIYDPAQIRPDLVVLDAGAHRVTASEIAVFCVSCNASVNGSGLRSGQGAIVQSEATITVNPSAKVLCARLNPV
ncbi:HutD/Ves family protein [Roseovarius arcticus]|uniref:HutD/Ves family protein n=1 Tax=Roseovarius arcticus TaxID=2547404 RepID=UPI001110EB42|nr:HutD family protein [Roseovarius arcticus]